jgi:Family of unknown function (DUF6081)
MIYDDFSVSGWPSPRWDRFRSPDHDLWDPAAAVQCPGAPANTLTLALRRFTQSHPNHVKALMLSTETYDIERSGRFTARVEMAVRTYDTEGNPYGLDPGDPRLAAGAFVTIDPATGMVFDFFVSNDRIAPLYERLPVARATLGPYPAYSILAAPEPSRPDAWHRYEIRYDGANDSVAWLIDGRRVHARSRVGAPVGRNAPIVKLRRLRFGGGLFTLLDDLCNDQERADDHPRIPGFIASNWDDRFGQGGVVSFRNFEIEL